MALEAVPVYRCCDLCEQWAPVTEWTHGPWAGEARCPLCKRTTTAGRCRESVNPLDARDDAGEKRSILEVYARDPAAALPFVLLRARRAMENAYPDDAKDLARVLERATAAGADVQNIARNALAAYELAVEELCVLLCIASSGDVGPTAEGHRVGCRASQAKIAAFRKSLDG